MSNPQETIRKQYLAVFDGAAGKAVLQDLYSKGRLMSPTFNTDPMRAAFNEGARSMALHIFNMLDTQGAKRAVAEQGDTSNG